ncbi:TolC family protein [Occallatibacter riparius]|uniref:TolC family protein n=1 Tax=Occallatibacter riparius TaxID=1002689 RepID=A0A9J7BRI0_9BACT|nr:TolC family protein [Occallatibacter riparius]UWZ85183.1 TolC family protein [Occallatibacter riparius]
MNVRLLLILSVLLIGQESVLAQTADSTAHQAMNLERAVDLALAHNHTVRIASLKVEETEHAREVARSAYLPTIKNDSVFAHLTDTQFISIPTGAFGKVGGVAIPSRTFVINQGEKTFETSGTGLVQPLTQIFKIKAANDAARADVDAGKAEARSVKDQVELKVRQLYYQILIVQSQHHAIEARIRAFEDLQSERIQQVKYGSTLEADLIDSRAQSLQAKQELLTSDLQLSDLRMRFNDVVGLPIETEVELDREVPAPVPSSSRQECIRLALDSNPEIAQANAVVEKASAGVREARREYIPDIEAFSRYSYQNNVPFLAHNFGTFGVHLSYDLYDGGKKRAVLRERESQVGQAKENLARITDEIRVKVLTAYNKLERTEQMIVVSKELLAARKEARRVAEQGLERGTSLRSQAEAAIAQESGAQTLLLQAQLEYSQAQDELSEAIGETKE